MVLPTPDQLCWAARRAAATSSCLGAMDLQSPTNADPHNALPFALIRAYKVRSQVCINVVRLTRTVALAGVQGFDASLA